MTLIVCSTVYTNPIHFMSGSDVMLMICWDIDTVDSLLSVMFALICPLSVPLIVLTRQQDSGECNARSKTLQSSYLSLGQ